MQRSNRRGFSLSALKRAYALDTRALALFRMGLGVSLVLDLWNRAGDLRAHYTDFGVLPRPSLLDFFASRFWHLGLHALSGGWVWQALLFLLAGSSALALALGIRTREALVLSWILNLSLQARNPLILSSGDVLIRLLLFWGLFLPLDHHGCLNGMKKVARRSESGLFFSAASLGLLFQVAFVYFFSGLFKCQVPAWQQGLGVYYAVKASVFSTPLGERLAGQVGFLKWICKPVLHFEIFGGLLLFVPLFGRAKKWVWVPRALACVSFWGFHLQTLLTLNIGMFPVFGMLAWVPLLPKEVLDFCMHRSKAGLKENWVKTKLGESRWVSFFSLFLIGYLAFWNFDSLGYENVWRFPERARWLGYSLGLDQKWSMFTFPTIQSGWYVVPGKLADGRVVEVGSDVQREGQAVSFQRPDSVSDSYGNDRWRKYLFTLYGDGGSARYLNYGRFLCRRWNELHQGPELLETFHIYFVREDSLPAGGRTSPAKELLWTHECFEGMAKKWGAWPDGSPM